MSIDLSGLDEAVDVNKDHSQGSSGSAREIKIEDIFPNPINPRKEFDSDSLTELANSISEHGVSSPVSVTPHPEKNGKWVLNYGERRLRASKLAGKTSIPCLISNELSDYELIIENLQRDNLTPMELAVFINEKLKNDFKAGEIAKKLGKSKSFINEHISLIKAPDFIQKLYTEGKTKSPRTIYDITKLYENDPEKVELWCSSADDVSRKSVSDLKLSLESVEPKNKTSGDGGDISPVNKSTIKEPKKNSADVQRLVRLIEDKIGLPILFSHTDSGSGKVSIKYNSLEELEGFLAHLNIDS
ncbi:MAG: ParB/RepB/Spo0J family partition protein [Cellvibrionaceae bacterium]